MGHSWTASLNNNKGLNHCKALNAQRKKLFARTKTDFYSIMPNEIMSENYGYCEDSSYHF